MDITATTTTDPGIKERILASAIAIFSSQGRGARMEHIAQHAGVNKALVYYHFQNRETLYKAAFKKQFRILLGEVEAQLRGNEFPQESCVASLKILVRSHFRAVSRHKDCVRFFAGAAADDPELVRTIVSEMTKEGRPPLLKTVLDLIESGIKNGELRKVNPKQFMISMVSLNLFFFVARPIAETFLDLQIEDEELFLEERLTSILDLLLYGTVERRSL